MIKAIIFDFDGVFTDGDYASYESDEFRAVNTDTDTFIEIEDEYSAVPDDSGFLPALRKAMPISVSDEEFWKIFNEETYTGLFEKLNQFANYKLFILSDQVATRARYLRDKHTFNEFEDVYFSCDIGVCKPDERAFNSILQQHALKPEECIFIDDWFENVEGANSMGIHGIQFSSLEQVMSDIKKIIENEVSQKIELSV
jgi:putative hydrolase of the HAD superfamily